MVTAFIDSLKMAVVQSAHNIGRIVESLGLVVATVIAVCSLLGFQFGLIYFLLNAKITLLEKRISNLEAG